MSTIGKRVIFAGAADSANSKPLTVEGIATEAGILPGSVVDYAAAGAGLELMDDAATVFGKPLLVADRDEIGNADIDTAWAVNESAVAIRPRSGEFLNVFVITGQALTVGAALTRSAAAPGALVIAATDGSEEVLCFADETVTTTGTQLVRVSVA